MAPKKKVDAEDVEKAKDEVVKGARAVGEAAKNVSGIGSRLEKIFTGAATPWGRTVHEIDELDAEFDKEDMMNTLRQKFEQGDVDVQVMQLGPNGTLVDVSDKVNPKDLRPEEFEGIHTEDGQELMSREMLINQSQPRHPRSREAALRLLQEILPGFKLDGGSGSTTNSIRKMEEALNESDKILQHWKK